MLRLLVAFWWAAGVVAPAAVATGPWDGQGKRPTETVDDCLSVAASFVQILGHDSHAVHHKKVKDDDLEICQQTTTTTSTDNRKSCCTLPVERHLQAAAVDAMREIMTSASQHLTDLLVINSQLYRNEFLNLMSLSKTATKQTLSSPSYKLPLTEIESIVDSLFHDLGRFMLRESGAEIESAIAEFFDAIFPSVLIYTINGLDAGDGALVLPAQRACFRAARRDLRPSPFADSVARLTGDLDRSLGVIRLLLEAFDLARDVINVTTASARFEADCARALTRLLRCSYCAGLVEVRPCRNLCMNVVHGCLAHLGDLNDRWNPFVDAVERVVLSMRGADDLQDYLGTFHFRISDSIMTAMETTHSYHSQIVSRCGPVSRSPRRDETPSPETGAGSPGALRQPASTRDPRGASSSSTSSSSSLGPSVRLHLKIEMFIRNLADSRDFYRKLPDSLCSSEKLSAGNYDVCWNGTSLGAYTRPVPVQDFSIQLTDNPEMRVSESRQTGLIKTAEKLENMTKILQSRVVPRLTSVQSDGRRTAHAHRTVETSGQGAVASGDGSHGDDEDDDDDDVSGGSTAEPEDVDLVTKNPRTGGRKGVEGGVGEDVEENGGGGGGGGGGRGDAIAYVTSADFIFTEKSTFRRVQSTTIRPSPEVVAQTSAGSTLHLNAGSLLLLLLLMMLLPLSTTLFSTASILLIKNFFLTRGYF